MNVHLLITAQAVAEAIAIEREACAKIAEWTDHGVNQPKAKAANDRIAAAIRARGALTTGKSEGGA